MIEQTRVHRNATRARRAVADGSGLNDSVPRAYGQDPCSACPAGESDSAAMTAGEFHPVKLPVAETLTILEYPTFTRSTSRARHFRKKANRIRRHIVRENWRRSSRGGNLCE